MAKPARTRNAALLIALAGVGLVVGATALEGTPGSVRQAASAAGVVIAVLASTTALVVHRDAQRQTRLQRGEGVIARWHIVASQWQAFVDTDRAHERQSGVLPNAVPLRRIPPHPGVDVIVGDNALLVGPRCYSLAKEVLVRVLRGWIEIEQRIPKSNGGVFQLAYRFPVPTGAEREADRVRWHFQSARAAATANPRFKRYIVAGLVGMVVLTTAIVVFRRG